MKLRTGRKNRGLMFERWFSEAGSSARRMLSFPDSGERSIPHAMRCRTAALAVQAAVPGNSGFLDLDNRGAGRDR